MILGAFLLCSCSLLLRCFFPKEIAYRTTAYYLLLCSFIYELAYVFVFFFLFLKSNSLCYVDYFLLIRSFDFPYMVGDICVFPLRGIQVLFTRHGIVG